MRVSGLCPVRVTGEFINAHVTIKRSSVSTHNPHQLPQYRIKVQAPASHCVCALHIVHPAPSRETYKRSRNSLLTAS